MRTLLLGERPRRIAGDALAFRNVPRYDRSGTGQRAVSDPNGGDQRRVRSDRDVAPDDRGVLLLSVEVAGDRPGADVGLFADRRVAEVRQVANLHAARQLRLLDLHEVPDVDAVSKVRLAAHVREWPDRNVVADGRIGDHASREP